VARISHGWQTLVAGVMWLVRNGTNYVRQSMQAEDLGIQASKSQPAR
jgi:hypothetical protein